MELNKYTIDFEIEDLHKQIHEFWKEKVYMTYTLDCVDRGVIESVDELVKRPKTNAKILTERYRKYRQSFAFNNLTYKEDLKWFEEAIARIKEMWDEVKNEGKDEGKTHSTTYG